MTEWTGAKPWGLMLPPGATKKLKQWVLFCKEQTLELEWWFQQQQSLLVCGKSAKGAAGVRDPVKTHGKGPP